MKPRWSVAVVGALMTACVSQAAWAQSQPGAQARSKAAPPLLSVTSPGKALVVTIGVGDQLTWSISLRDRVVLRPSPIAMTLEGNRVLGAKPEVSASNTRSVDQTLKPIVRIKRAEVRDRFNERRIDFAGGYSLIVRACDEGRLQTRLQPSDEPGHALPATGDVCRV